LKKDDPAPLGGTIISVRRGVSMGGRLYMGESPVNYVILSIAGNREKYSIG